MAKSPATGRFIPKESVVFFSLNCCETRIVDSELKEVIVPADQPIICAWATKAASNTVRFVEKKAKSGAAEIIG